MATTGLGLAQTELGGLRRDIKDILSSSALPATKTPDQREDRRQVYRKGLARDEKIEKLGRSLFFGEEPIVINPPSPEEKTSKAEEKTVESKPKSKYVTTEEESMELLTSNR